MPRALEGDRTLHGDTPYDEREEIQGTFWNDPVARVLVATNAAVEGDRGAEGRDVELSQHRADELHRQHGGFGGRTVDSVERRSKV